MSLLWKIVWKFFNKLFVIYSSIFFISTYSEEHKTGIQKDLAYEYLYGKMNKGKSGNNSNVNQLMSPNYFHIIEYYTIIKSDEIFIRATTWVYLEGILYGDIG